MTATESPPYQIDPLSDQHDRAAFASGVEPALSIALTAIEQFYTRYHFLKLLAGSRRMFLPITEIAALFV